MNAIDNMFNNLSKQWGYGLAFLFILFLPVILCIVGLLARFFHPDKPKFLKRFDNWFDALVSDNK